MKANYQESAARSRLKSGLHSKSINIIDGSLILCPCSHVREKIAIISRSGSVCSLIELIQT